MPASQSEGINTVHKRRQTEDRNTDHEGLRINSFRVFALENIHTWLMASQYSAPSIF